ncbi:hypothetical protein [Viridibacillus arvi]|uniref:hypothetical protein n=1 Tax=Viridibacillus arvi TaxID=263475 RepID=UPI0034CE1C0B
MKNFNAEDMKKNQRFPALTQEEVVTIDELVTNCNKTSKVEGFISTRKNVLHTRFDRGALIEYIELVPHFDKDNQFFVGTVKTIIEKFSRDIVLDCWVDDLVQATKMKLDHFNGNVQDVADCIENYFKSGKVTPMSQTWRERTEEIEKGMIIYYAPDPSRTV